MSLTSLILISLKKDDGGGGVKSAVKIVYTLKEKIKIYKKNQFNNDDFIHI